MGNDHNNKDHRVKNNAQVRCYKYHLGRFFWRGCNQFGEKETSQSGEASLLDHAEADAKSSSDNLYG